ncbi:GNAT family N-acetyltransferase [archaeon]|nr:GNAT family N-acetyltransferase [archaeon]
MEYKTLKEEDYEKLVKLWEECEIHYRKTGRDSKERVSKEIREMKVIGAFDGNCLAGAVIVTNDGRKGEICRLAVKKEYRRRGIASRLIEQAENFLNQECTEIKFVTIEKTNSTSLTLFKKLGYKVHENILYVSKRPHNDA